MDAENEIVSVDLDYGDKVALLGASQQRMEAMGLRPEDFSSLHLGFAVPPGWPVEHGCEPTLAQLVVLTRKLGMRLVITGVRVEPMRLMERDDGDTE